MLCTLILAAHNYLYNMYQIMSYLYLNYTFCKNKYPFPICIIRYNEHEADQRVDGGVVSGAVSGVVSRVVSGVVSGAVSRVVSGVVSGVVSEVLSAMCRSSRA